MESFGYRCAVPFGGRSFGGVLPGRDVGTLTCVLELEGGNVVVASGGGCGGAARELDLDGSGVFGGGGGKASCACGGRGGD
ncbi:MAG: hypothetical protein GY772_12760 [bacterium]|nr:hypothetical protein [bacterium]